MGQIDNAESARRCARAIVSDIGLYNEDKVAEGLKNDNLFELLESEIDEGREYYKSKVPTEVDSNHSFFEVALVDVLIKNRGHIKTNIW